MKLIALSLLLLAGATQAQTVTITPETSTIGYHSYKLKIQGGEQTGVQVTPQVQAPQVIIVPQAPAPTYQPMSPQLALAIAQYMANSQQYQPPERNFGNATEPWDNPMLTPEQRAAEYDAYHHDHKVSHSCKDIAPEYRKYCKD